MMNLIQYIIAIILVILFLIGFALLSLRLHTREEILQRPREKVQPQEIEGLPSTDNPPKRGLLDIFKGERTIGF